MSPFYLKFASETEGRQELGAAGLLKDLSVDIIGTLYTSTVFGDGMKVVTPAAEKPGWHANWIGEALPKSLEPFAITPTTPYRVFAGWHPDDIAARAAK